MVCITILLFISALVIQCEVEETCPSCVDPDFTILLFDTTNIGFQKNEIDSFSIIRFPPGELNNPIDTSGIIVSQNPFLLSRGLFGSSTLSNDFVVEGVNQEFRFEITDIEFTIKSAGGNCGCDLAEINLFRSMAV